MRGKKMPISQIMGATVYTVTEDTTIQEAAAKMSQLKIGAIIVGTPEHIEGIISERDIMVKVVAQGVSPQNTPVKDLMTRNVLTINQNENEDTALKIMEEKKFRHLPVVADDGTCVGMLGIRDILRSKVVQLKDENQNLSQYALAVTDYSSEGGRI
jgi:CBS domain-containing protein